MEPNEFVEPTAKTRRNLLALFAIALLVGGLFTLVLKPALLGFITQLPVCEQARWSFGLLIAYLCPLPVIAVWTGNYARKLLKFNQSPLPGAWVWRRTPVKRGRLVRLQAYATIACSATLLIAPFYAWYVLQPMFAAVSQRCAA
jgi:hypothetical protein